MRRCFGSHKRWPLHSSRSAIRSGMSAVFAHAFGTESLLFPKRNNPITGITSWCEVKSRALQRLSQCSYRPPIAIDVTEHNMKQALTHSADLHRFSVACGEECIRHASRQATYSGNRHFDACTFYRGTCAGGCTLEFRTYLVRGKLRVSSVYHLGPCAHDNSGCCCDVNVSAMG